MQDIKTLGQLFQEVIEKDDDKRYSIHEFLCYGTREDMKRVEKMLTDADQKQFYEYMDGYNFVNESEVEMAVCEYVEHVNQQPLGMGEMGDISEIAEDYIRDRKLEFDED